MFNVEAKPKFWADIKVITPTDEGGREDTFKARFQMQPADEVEKAQSVLDVEPMKAFLRTAVIGLDDVTGDDGKPLPFSKDLLDKVINHFGARTALWNAYTTEVTRTRLGN